MQLSKHRCLLALIPNCSTWLSMSLRAKHVDLVSILSNSVSMTAIRRPSTRSLNVPRPTLPSSGDNACSRKVPQAANPKTHLQSKHWHVLSPLLPPSSFLGHSFLRKVKSYFLYSVDRIHSFIQSWRPFSFLRELIVGLSISVY